MKNLSITVLLSLLVLNLLACNIGENKYEGIKFEKGSWAEVKAKAKKTNRLVFVDCYTVWCGPCKTLSKNVFPVKEVGDYFNANFINYKVDMEKGEGIDLKNKFHVGAFPTLLWVDHKGNVIHRYVGAPKPDGLIQQGKLAAQGGNASVFRQLEKNYNANKKNPVVVKEYLDALAKNYDKRSKEVAEHYLSLIPKEQYLEEGTWAIISKQIQSPFSPVIEYIYANRAKFEKKFTKENVNMVLTNKYYIYGGNLASAVKDGKTFDKAEFQKLISLMEERGFEAKEQVTEYVNLSVLQNKKDWEGYVAKIEDRIANGYYRKLDFYTCYNLYSPIITSKTTNKDVINKALGWVDSAIEAEKTSFNINTFKMCWEAKIKLTEKLGSSYKNEVDKLKVELSLLDFLNTKQTQYKQHIQNINNARSGNESNAKKDPSKKKSVKMIKFDKGMRR